MRVPVGPMRAAIRPCAVVTSSNPASLTAARTRASTAREAMKKSNPRFSSSPSFDPPSGPPPRWVSELMHPLDIGQKVEPLWFDHHTKTGGRHGPRRGVADDRPRALRAGRSDGDLQRRGVGDPVTVPGGAGGGGGG